MEEKVVNKKNKKTLLIVGILCFVAIISIVGYTYSYLQITASKEGVITGTAASLSLELNVTKVAPDINKPLVPQLDSAITSAVVGKKGNCIDDNENAVCQVYEVKVKNTSNTAMQVTGMLELDAGSNPNLKWALIDSYSDGMTSNPDLESDVKKHEDTIITDNETYTSQQEKTYYLVVWISETTFAQADTGSFTGVITFMDSASAPAPAPALLTLKALNLESSLGTGTPNFANTSCSSGCDEATVGIYSTEDDLGTSYYFRGDVTNNYVSFAGKIWRIIRINGDGTVRMIADKTIGNSQFNQDGSIDYVNSDVLNYIENNFYANLSADDKEYIADAIYCNNKNITKEQVYDVESLNFQEIFVSYGNDNGSSLICPRAEDRYTLVNSQIETKDGLGTNPSIDIPVGLITADEVILAGGAANKQNDYFYLKGGDEYYFITMSPDYSKYEVWFDVSNERDLMFSYFWGLISGYFAPNPSADDFVDVRPVISLESDALKYSATSNGSMEYPFTVTG